jgi:protein phosphatase
MTDPNLADTVDSSAEPAPPPRAGFFGPPRTPVTIDFGAVSHPGRVRANNEDHFFIVRRSRARTVLATNLPESALPLPDEDEAYSLAVADGMGGAVFGEMASMLALRTAWELGGQEVQWPLKVNADVAREILEKLEAGGQLILGALQEQGRDDPRLAGMGTTLTVAYTVGLDAFLGHVGDSRAYRFRQGKLEQLTRDHTLAQEILDTGLLPPGAFELRRLKHVLVNCLSATAKPVRVEVQHRRLASGDRLLLCSDGLTDMVPDEEIARTLARVPAAQEACQALLDLALDAGGRDNVTVVLARYESPGG